MTVAVITQIAYAAQTLFDPAGTAGRLVDLGKLANYGLLGAAVPSFSPAILFASGEPGAWYDPSDLSTLFQDSAGTIPVTAVEQPVGLMLDKSNGLVLGGENVPASYSGTASTGWVINATSVTRNASTGNASLTLSKALVTGKFYLIQFEVANKTGDDFAIRVGSGAGDAQRVTSNGVITFRTQAVGSGAVLWFGGWNGTQGTFTATNISVRELPGNHAFASSSANRAVLSARVNKLLNTETLATHSVTTVAASHTLRFTGTGSITLSGTATGTYTAGSYAITTTAGTLTLTVSGTVTQADLRVANQGVNLPPYQRVGAEIDGTPTAPGNGDYDTAGFPLYLKANGTNTAMQTNSVDFTGTDKMTMVAGVRKLSDAATGFISEFSSNADSNAGSFYFSASVPSGTENYEISDGPVGARAYVKASPFSAPVTSVISTFIDRAGIAAAGEIAVRVNATIPTLVYTDNGLASGNFGNYPLFLFARNASSLFFNGQFYGAIIRGAQSTAAQISSAESYIAKKTGLYGGYNYLSSSAGDQLVTSSGNSLITGQTYQ